jgi:predicted  nucleic acid-binding Zn-ribbon protein
VVDRHNVELGTAEEMVRKLEGQKMTLKTNEEYATMQRQIDAKRAEMDALESRILEAMEVVENARNGLPPRKAELARREADLAAARSRVDAETAETEGEIAGLQAQWDAFAANVSGKLVREYSITRDRRNGRGLAALSPDNKCQECYISVHPQLMIEVLRGDMIPCPSCNRLLYLLA